MNDVTSLQITDFGLLRRSEISSVVAAETLASSLHIERNETKIRV